MESKLLLGDCLELLSTLTADSIDMVLCDLPYGCTQNKWDSVIPFGPLWAAYHNICKKNKALVFTTSQPFGSALVMSNPVAFKYEWVWKKNLATGHLNAKRMPMKQHELVEVFSFGNCPYSPQGATICNKIVKRGHNGSNYNASDNTSVQTMENYPRSILDIPCDRPSRHPTQKPVALMEYLIRTYTQEKDTVLDNCMGSGTTGVACIRTNRNFIGIEKDPQYFSIAEKRIQEAVHA